MKKITIASMLNDEEENYIKIKINDINSKKYIEILIDFLDDLGTNYHLFDEDIRCLSEKYKEWIGSHHYFRTKGYIIHIIFAEKYLHLIIKCNLNNRNKLIKILEKYCKWIITKPKRKKMVKE